VSGLGYSFASPAGWRRVSEVGLLAPDGAAMITLGHAWVAPGRAPASSTAIKMLDAALGEGWRGAALPMPDGLEGAWLRGTARGLIRELALIVVAAMVVPARLDRRAGAATARAVFVASLRSIRCETRQPVAAEALLHWLD